jgi:signal transduction histidine kinase
MQDAYKEVIIVLIAGSFIFLCFSGILIYIFLFYQKKKFQHRQELADIKNATEKELLKTKLETQEETYQQIGEELHDNVAQLLSSAYILLGMTERALPEPPDTLLIAAESLSKAIKEIRSLSKSLSKEWLVQFNLVENLQAEAERINAAQSVRAEIRSEEKFLPLPEEMQIVVFRIVQEAIHNCIKHAVSTEIGVDIFLKENEIEIIIADNGRGFYISDHQKPKGIGIMNMIRRTKLLHGKIAWLPGEKTGTRVLINLPVKNNET